MIDFNSLLNKPTIPSTLPPTGPAGGGLSGSYPNPSLNIPAGSIPASSVGSSPLFGDGSDGNITIAVDTILVRDMYYNSLTVNNGFNLNSNGFRVFVRGTCTLNGTIRNNGGPGSGGGAGALSGTLGGGTPGGFSDVMNSPGVPGSIANNSAGGSGGSGGASNTVLLVASGAPANAPAAIDGGTQALRAVPQALTCRLLSGVAILGGAGGSGGTTTNTGGTGGRAGGGGGVVLLSAHDFAGSGSVQAKGGDGAPGANPAADGGGGGGGGGVVVIVTTAALPGTISVNVAGGAGGRGPAAPAAAAGAVGTAIVLY